MTLSVTGDLRHSLTYESFKFSGGEIQVRLKGEISKGKDFSIDAFLFSSDDIVALILLVDALRRAAGRPINISLVCPYLPYARQDRVCASGESLALKVMCDIINGLNFSSVTVWDVHSDVSLALLNNIYNVPQKTFVSRIKWANVGGTGKSEIVATAFKCILTSMEHRCREWFLYKGKAIYQPHYNVDALHAICDQREVRA